MWDLHNIQYSKRSRSRASSLDDFQKMGTWSKDRLRTGTELVKLWYNSISQCDMWIKRASEIWPAMGYDGDGGADWETTARRWSLGRGQDSLRPYPRHFRLDREQLVQVGLARSQLMAWPGQVRGFLASLLGPVLYLPWHVVQPAGAVVICPFRMVVLVSRAWT